MDVTLNTIDIVVSDLAAATRFYGRLGLEFEVHPDAPGHAGCDLPNGLHVMLDTEDFRASFTPGWTRPGGGPRGFLCFQFPTPAEVDAKYAELVEAGYRGVREPWDTFWGLRQATVLDPDGTGVDLWAALPAT
ncbi:VOC family protein [Bailinhaonella thermotolerans]|uniref:Glyoxalase n=1 Tax=Bailinhaonella thermotolerans TaxID=1070861 RepID=A0A3A4AS90_9ACTN|nr:VOC family protein [Bailinhaonella thermotolerans]RJL30164.1 glyoxalase [Bailinhaonella thermotolerans]